MPLFLPAVTWEPVWGWRWTQAPRWGWGLAYDWVLRPVWGIVGWAWGWVETWVRRLMQTVVAWSGQWTFVPDYRKQYRRAREAWWNALLAGESPSASELDRLSGYLSAADRQAVDDELAQRHGAAALAAAQRHADDWLRLAEHGRLAEAAAEESRFWQVERALQAGGRMRCAPVYRP